MTSIHITINGREILADVEPRLHLADFCETTEILPRRICAASKAPAAPARC